MIKTIRTKDLKVGMHVIIPASWMNHPFAKGQFDIKSKDQIQKIIDQGFAEVKIDDSKSFAVIESEKSDLEDKRMDLAPKWEPDKLVPAELREAIRDKNLAPQKRAAAVYESSVKLMGRL